MLTDEHTSISHWQDHPNALAKVLQTIAELAPETDQEGQFPEQAFLELGNAGLLAVTLPDQPLDGQQANTADLLALLKRVGSANLAVGRVYEGHINALLLAQVYGTSQQQERWFSDVLRRQTLFSVWNTQAGDGVSIHALGKGRYELKGCKTFCSGANWIDRPLITGELIVDGQARGWQMCILPAAAVDETNIDDQFWTPLGMRASASFKIDFTGVIITDDDLLGKPGDYFRQPYFSGGAIRFAAVQLGGAEAMLDATRDLLRSMNRTDDPFQKTRLAEMAIRIESGNLWLAQAGANNDAWLRAGTHRPDLTAELASKTVAYANMTRTAIEAICLDVMRLAERSVGARGLLRPLAFERIHRDLTMYLRQPAPDATLADIGQYVSQQQTPSHDLWT
ncbi:acyl-CoA dehydrogenase family protein [Fibrella forsythiae]|uniref:Acyl-CoA dehydrogenase family protein n=1 Tax=Fibrella forsythiae TaxID=2817061 RepID=A0ABS3JEQ1_9BACT|nr:acyl-CoA dehydrogenase family protein [Fibrella forsythiae]MBO0948489.1 acyl-CoA dehydrogenase family protein [Fibrella forsythiae]